MLTEYSSTGINYLATRDSIARRCSRFTFDTICNYCKWEFNCLKSFGTYLCGLFIQFVGDLDEIFWGEKFGCSHNNAEVY